MKGHLIKAAFRRGHLDRALTWFDQRTGAKSIASKVLDEPIPGGARWAYVFGSGLLFIFLLQMVTGIALALHFLQTFIYGSFKGKRELLWMSGALLSFLVLGMGFTGYLLPWDQKAYFATAVGTNVAGEGGLVVY